MNNIRAFFYSTQTSLHQLTGLSNYKVIQIDPYNLSSEMQSKLKSFELVFDYPFDAGSRFRILHGKDGGDYFGFFKRMGDVKFYIAVHSKNRTVIKINRLKLPDGTSREVAEKIEFKAGDIAAVGCGILRKIPRPNWWPLRAWYLCDLKVDPRCRGDHLPSQIYRKAAWRYFQCPRGYAICMNPSDNSTPLAAEIWQRHGPIKGNNSITLNLYSMGHAQMSACRNELRNILGEDVTFKTMKGLKEFEIYSVEAPHHARPWNLLHIQHGPNLN